MQPATRHGPPFSPTGFWVGQGPRCPTSTQAPTLFSHWVLGEAKATPPFAYIKAHPFFPLGFGRSNGHPAGPRAQTPTLFSHWVLGEVAAKQPGQAPQKGL